MSSTANDVSVIIPAYNCEDVIEETLASVFDQTVAPGEILVMDDGSPDGTAERVERFAPRVTLFRQENQGPSRARNELIRRARGKWIALLDADDLWHPSYLETQLVAVRRYPEAVVVGTAFRDLPEGQGRPPWETLGTAETELIPSREFLQRFNDGSGIILPSFALVRAEAFRRMGEHPMPLNLRGVEDVYLWYHLGLFGPFARTPVRAGYYRLLWRSLSNDRLRAFRDRVAAMEQVVELYRREADASWVRFATRHLTCAHRQAAKYFLGVGDQVSARHQLQRALRTSFDLKSLGLFGLSFLPRTWQPAWPARYRFQMLNDAV